MNQSQICLGWQFAPATGDPGPAPVRPSGPAIGDFDQAWADAQRRITARLARPAALGGTVSVVAVLAITALLLDGLASPALAGGCCVTVSVLGLRSARSLWRGERRLRTVLSAERQRVTTSRAQGVASLAADQREHAIEYRAWQRRRAVFDRQPAWFGVSLPDGIDRLDVAGGTLGGWSALLTTLGATQLSAGGQLTAVDLTEGTSAVDLVRLAASSGMRPLVWVLPRDLRRLDLGAGLGQRALADVLAVAAGADTEGFRDRHPADCALIERVLLALDSEEPSIAGLTAALRVLAQIGDPRAELAAGLLDAGQLERIGMLFGRGSADRLVIERAWALESRLRSLAALSASPVLLPPSPLRVLALDRRVGVSGNQAIRTYLVAALTQLVREVPAGRPWQHTICVLGAERLQPDLADRLTSACEISRTGLVLAYAAISPWVRERLGRGNAAIAFMRLGNGDDAKAASELIGSEHRFVVSQLTETVGTSVTDTQGDSYTSTVGTADSVSESLSASRGSGGSTGRGRSQQSGFAPFSDFSRSSSRDSNYSIGSQESWSLTRGINSGTSWGLNTSRALGENASAGLTAQRSREFLVEPEELQRLPPSAAIISYPSAAGRTVVLADANPAIVTLPGATMAPPPDA